MVIVDEIKKSNRKTLSIKVDSLGKVIVYAPYYYSDKKIMEIVQSKEKWIEKCKNKTVESNNIYDTKNIAINDKIYLFGEQYTLQIANVKKPVIDGKSVFLPVNYQNNLEKHLKKWIKEQADVYLNDILNDVARRLNFSDYTFKITSARAKWGSCSSKREIMLNFRLIECPLEIIEYVAVHELIHLLYFNHGKYFYQKLASIYPNYKEYINWLKQNAGILNSY